MMKIIPESCALNLISTFFFIKVSIQTFDTCDYIYDYIRTEDENKLTELRHAYTLIVFVYTAYMIMIWFFFIISIQKCVEA